MRKRHILDLVLIGLVLLTFRPQTVISIELSVTNEEYYVVYSDGDKAYCIDVASDSTVKEGRDHASVINYAFSNLPYNRSRYFTVALRGIFRLGDSLQVKYYTNVEAQGTFTLLPGLNIPMLSVEGQHDVKINGGSWKGNRGTGNDVSSSWGMFFHLTTDFEAHNVKISDTGWSGIYVLESSNGLVDDGKVLYCGRGIETEKRTYDVTIKKTDVLYSFDVGINADTGTRDMRVTECKIMCSQYSGLEISHAGHLGWYTDNIIRHNGRSKNTNHYHRIDGIYHRGGYAIISRNTCELNYGDGIFVESYNPSIISNNYCRENSKIYTYLGVFNGITVVGSGHTLDMNNCFDIRRNPRQGYGTALYGSNNVVTYGKQEPNKLGSIFDGGLDNIILTS